MRIAFIPLLGCALLAGVRPLEAHSFARDPAGAACAPVRRAAVRSAPARPHAGGGSGRADTVPAPGIPRALAIERAARVSALRYDLRLSIPRALTERVRGEETIRFQLSDAGRPLALDFQQDSTAVRSVEVNGRPAACVVARGHILLPARSLRAGENAVHIRFLAGDAALNRNPDYLYTLFVPARASTALPVFDQPDLKGRFALTLELPAEWEAVSNGLAVAGARLAGERRTVAFERTPPLPTYLFAFAAGKWTIDRAVRHGRTLRMFHRETDAAKVARNRDSVFDLVDRSLAYMERYTGIPYAFAKFDFVLVPSFQFGGMEHPGQILFNASSVLLDESATQNQKLARASLIAHETAHMWFGDLVTMRWFDDVWMKEVFANFMAAKIVNPSFPQVDHELRFLLEHYPSAYGVDRTAGTHPIRQRLDNLDEAAQLYGNIIYDKAPIVMRMLEELVGAERFRVGAAAYLKGYAFANASWPDLIDALDRLVPERRLRDWSRVWVEEAGRPIIRTGVAISPSGRVAGITLQQADPTGRGRVWTQPASVALVYGDTARMLPVFLDGPLVQVPGAAGLPAPDFVLPNGDTHAYGLMVLDADRRAALLRALPHLRDRRLRGAAWLDAWDALLEHQVAPGEFMAVALQALEREPDEQLQQRVLTYTADAYWHFLDSPARAALAPRLEQLLWSRLAAATTTSQRAAWFGTIRSVALTTESIERLRRIWAKQDSIPGLPLAEQDYTGLAMDLAVRGVAQADSILAAQETRIQNPDRKARLAFVRPALSPDTAVRGAWFRSLAEPANRRHEPWVVEGLVYLDHPLRQADAERYLRPALDMLAEVRRTGDIFFPARWVNAALWGHTSSAAAGTVLSFLAANPNYPERLRQLVLQAADELFRVTGVAWPK